MRDPRVPSKVSSMLLRRYAAFGKSAALWQGLADGVTLHARAPGLPIQGIQTLRQGAARVVLSNGQYEAIRAAALTTVASAPESFACGKSVSPRAGAILGFWLGEDFLNAPMNSTAGEKAKLWFGGGPEVDKACCNLFSNDLEEAALGNLDTWNSGYDGLAAVILMDQISRNVYRGSARTFALDEKAMQLAKRIHDEKSAVDFPPMHRCWLYMTLMHSEDLKDQKLCVQRFEELTEEARRIPKAKELVEQLQNNVNYAQAHCTVVQRFGRFPHRNSILGRQNTPEEEQGLKDGSIPKF